MINNRPRVLKVINVREFFTSNTNELKLKCLGFPNVCLQKKFMMFKIFENNNQKRDSISSSK